MRIGGVEVSVHIHPQTHTPPSYMLGRVGCVVVCGLARRAGYMYTLTSIHIYDAYAYNVAKYILCDTNIIRTNRGGYLYDHSMFIYI